MSIDEFTLLGQLLAETPTQAEALLCGVGDDCAVVSGGAHRDWLISTDHCVEGIHFRRSWAEWSVLGGKAALAALSDIAAMGGRPRFVLVGLGIPDSMCAAEVRECFRGVRVAATDAGALVIGGDTTRAELGCHLAITVIGEVPHGRALYRRGARPGDSLYVTGWLGGSAAGLQLLMARDQSEGATSADPLSRDRLMQRHLHPPLRTAAGQWLASTGCVSAMIDISDGLLADVGQIATASGVRVQIEAVRVPLCEGVTAVAEARGEDPLAFGAASGEEYELAFTVFGSRAAAFRQLVAGAERTLGHPLTYLGEVQEGAGVALSDPNGRSMPIASSGFAHQFQE
ncbi:MAG: thiamine-phosphate kinase [Deltaproteobacteria bacterium]|nr:thiamine-phosphate kinase [Deltaproteobacteria bacterium]